MNITSICFVIISLGIIPSNSYASDFDKAVLLVLKHEGKLVDDPNDRGGITNYGVSLRFLKGLVKISPELLFNFDLNKNNIIDAYDIRHMTVDEATDLYKKEWWNKYGYHRIENQLMATKIFDFSVNMGHKKSIKLAQEAFNKMRVGIYLAVDGKLGENTVNALNGLSANGKKRFLAEYSKEAVYFYEYLAKINPIYKRFVKGWTRRAKEVM